MVPGARAAACRALPYLLNSPVVDTYLATVQPRLKQGLRRSLRTLKTRGRGIQQCEPHRLVPHVLRLALVTGAPFQSLRQCRLAGLLYLGMPVIFLRAQADSKHVRPPSRSAVAVAAVPPRWRVAHRYREVASSLIYIAWSERSSPRNENTDMRDIGQPCARLRRCAPQVTAVPNHTSRPQRAMAILPLCGEQGNTNRRTTQLGCTCGALASLHDGIPGPTGAGWSFRQLQLAIYDRLLVDRLLLLKAWVGKRPARRAHSPDGQGN